MLYALSAAILGTTSLLAGCDAFSTDTHTEDEFQIQPRVLRQSDPEFSEAQMAVAQAARKGDEKLVQIQASYAGNDDDEDTVAVKGSQAIPYPIYPGAIQYRVGGENGLNIVLFETPHNFQSVDQFYKTYLEEEEFQRLVGMDDYVRYNEVVSVADSDADPASDPASAWSNESPGIVIHSFNNVTDAESSGANPSARTNIIVSYKN